MYILNKKPLYIIDVFVIYSGTQRLIFLDKFDCDGGTKTWDYIIYQKLSLEALPGTRHCEERSLRRGNPEISAIVSGLPRRKERSSQ